MPMPQEYWHATRDFEAFMADLKKEAMLPTHNVTYTMLEGVFRTFRARLNIADACRFADVLPPVLRAIFVSGWQPQQPLPFADRKMLETEVRDLRRNHNFSPDNSIASVATVLRRHVDEQRFDETLNKLPSAAQDFWKVEET